MSRRRAEGDRADGDRAEGGRVVDDRTELDRPVVDHVATADCERCRPGPIAQPANTWSSLAYVVAGAVLLRRSGLRFPGREAPSAREAVGWAAVATGLGSVAYHGPGTAAGRFAHDASLIGLLSTMALDDLEVLAGREAAPSVLAVVPALAALAAHPRTSPVAQTVAGAAAAVAGTRRAVRHGGAPVVGIGLMAVGAVLHGLGRTGGPLCRPESRIQPHALWHIATAASLVLRDDRT